MKREQQSRESLDTSLPDIHGPNVAPGKSPAVERRYAATQPAQAVLPHRSPILRNAVQFLAYSGQQYTVQRGDTLGAIARRLLGSTDQWTRIAEANGIDDPTKLQIGQVLTIPGAAAQAETQGAGTGQESAGQEDGQEQSGTSAGTGEQATTPEETTAQDGQAEAASVQHVVQRGDTLGAIARRYLGSAGQWQAIADANGITDPTKLRIGQVLQIPGGSASTGQSSQEAGQTGTSTTGTEQANGQGQGQEQSTSGQAEQGQGESQGTGEQGQTEQGTGEQGQTEQGQTEGQTTTGPDDAETGTTPPETRPTGTYTITDPRALVRTPPPDLQSTSDVVPAGTQVRIVETAVKDRREYVLVEQVLQEGEQGTPQRYGWTSKANLGGFEGGGHANEHDESLRPDDVVLLTGLSGLDRQMAIIYNAKGRFLHEQAQALGVGTAAAAAVLKVESRGQGFADDGRMIIRFENHVFHRYWGQSNQEQFNRHFRFNSGERWKGHQFRASENEAWQDFHGNQGKEWQVLEFARGLDNDGALQSISMGAAQIMGFNYQKEGYQSVQEMFDNMSGAIRPQLVGMFTFIENTPLCLTGLREGNYVKFARGYNGSGQAEAYGSNIQAAADAFTRVTRGKRFTD